jgi:molecular chaperone GrpE (heat shock protein)
MSDTPPVQVHVDDPNKTAEPPHVEVHNHPVETAPTVDTTEVERLREENERLRTEREEEREAFRASILEEVQKKILEGMDATREVVGEVVNDAASSVPEVEITPGSENPNEPPVAVEIEEEPAPAKREHWWFR